MNKEIEHKGMLKKPKYCVGDIVVYPDRYDGINSSRGDDGDSMLILIQSNITEAIGYLETGEPDDEVGWFYNTEETVRNAADNLEESEILYKLAVSCH